MCCEHSVNIDEDDDIYQKVKAIRIFIIQLMSMETT